MISKLFNQKKKLLLNGVFGLIKEKGDTIDDYKTWIKLTHYHESQMESYPKNWNSPSIILDLSPYFVEPFTTGVVCVGIGSWSSRLASLAYFLPHEWLVSAKLGTQTQHFCIDSPVVQQMPFNHINETLLRETINQFLGSKPQLSPPYIQRESLLIPKPSSKTSLQDLSIKEPAPRIRMCHSIEVLSFRPPDLTLKVISEGPFSCRSFIHDLGLRLNSCAHLTDLCLNRMGVITPEMCLKKYELHGKQISEAIDKYSKLFSKELEKFKELKPNRRVI